jgi:serine phosphatase RsbU (regulator of sigma subunit)
VVALSQQLSARASEPVAGLRYAAALRPAEGLLAGDWVDVVPLKGNRVALMLLDVSGHGAAAGLEAMRLKTVLTTVMCLGRPPHEALAQAAEGFTEDERFATAVIAVLDTATGELRWANAGHLSPRLVPLNISSVTPDDLPMLEPTGPILSSLTGGWTTKTAQLSIGQMLLAFSDGLTEARDAAGVEFGIDGICRALSDTTVRDVDTAVSVCLAAVRAHAVDVHRDDITMLAVTRDPSTVIPAELPEPSVRSRRG